MRFRGMKSRKYLAFDLHRRNLVSNRLFRRWAKFAEKGRSDLPFGESSNHHQAQLEYGADVWRGADKFERIDALNTLVSVFLGTAISYFLAFWTPSMLTNDCGKRVARKHVGEIPSRHVDRYSNISQWEQLRIKKHDFMRLARKETTSSSFVIRNNIDTLSECQARSTEFIFYRHCNNRAYVHTCTCTIICLNISLYQYICLLVLRHWSSLEINNRLYSSNFIRKLHRTQRTASITQISTLLLFRTWIRRNPSAGRTREWEQSFPRKEKLPIRGKRGGREEG